MLYIIELPEEREQELREALSAIQPDAPSPVRAVWGEAGRTARLDHVQEFYQEDLAPGYPDLKEWDDLNGKQQRAVARILADDVNWQFADAYRTDREELQGLMKQAIPGIKKDAGTGDQLPALQ